MGTWALIIERDPIMSGATGIAPITLYLSYSANESSYSANAIKANPQQGLLLNYFQKVAPSLTTPAALLGNFKALTVVLTAFGLQGAIANTALLKKLLTQDPTAKTSLAQQLGNQKYLLLATALSKWTPPPFSTPANVNSIVSAYKTNTFEAGAETQAPGLQAALYFTRSIGSITKLTQLQSDPSLLAVVVTGVGLPIDNFNALDFSQQTAILKSKVDLTKFQNPAYVKRFAEQYLLSKQINAQSSSPAPGTLAAAFDDSTDNSGDSLLSILNPSSTDSTSGSSGNLLSLFA